MTSPRNRMPRPLPPSDARVEVTPRGRSVFGTRKWHLQLVDGAAVIDLGLVYGNRDAAEDEAHAALRTHLLPDEVDGAFTVRGMPTRGPSGPAGQARAR